MATPGSFVTSIRLSASTKESIDQLAAATGRSRSYLLTEAIERYVAYETWFVKQVEEALRDEAEHGHEPGYYATTDDVIEDLLARNVISPEHWAGVARQTTG
jgi:RHH-type transcriptional regulator, rel operon repressor / antitoxin RelB